MRPACASATRKLKYMLEYALEASKAEIEKILDRLRRAAGAVQPLPDRGNVALARRLHQAPRTEFAPKPEAATPDQVVTEQRLETWLAEGADLTQELSNAVLAADVERIKFLVKTKGADINARDPQGYAPVHTAARNRHPDLIALLADLGADLNAPDGDGMTPLMHAAMRNHVPTVKMLLQRGADIEKPNAQGYPPLALSIAEAKFEVAKALLEAGADINTSRGPRAADAADGCCKPGLARRRRYLPARQHASHRHRARTHPAAAPTSMRTPSTA